MPAPPNILWICTDQQRYDTIHALGNERIRTPHIDALIESGVAFTHAYAQSPVCSPSRASFLTGRYPRTTRCRQNGQKIPADERLISRLLADAGYTCGLAGKLHLASCANGRVEERTDDGYSTFLWSHHPQPDWPENAYTQWLAQHGKTWDELYHGPANVETPYVKVGVPTEFHQTKWCADMAIAFMREHAPSGSERSGSLNAHTSSPGASSASPWLFSFNCYDPHHPFDPPPEYATRYGPADMPLPKFKPGELDGKPKFQQLDHEFAHSNLNEYHVAAMTERDMRQVTAAYWAMCELIDDQIGRMIAALKETGQYENTIVIFMSDHGELLGDHGIYLKGPHFYDPAVRVPLVISWPGRFKAGLRSDALIELLDLAPTLMAACGLDVPMRMQGKSLLPILTGQADPSQHREHVFSEYYNAWSHKHAYGSMLRTRDQKICVYHGVDDGVDGELYDLSDDPDEFDNLWNDERAAELKRDLLKCCFDASVFTMDPLPERLGPF